MNNSSLNNQLLPVDAIRILGIHKRAGEPLVSRWVTAFLDMKCHAAQSQLLICYWNCAHAYLSDLRPLYEYTADDLSIMEPMKRNQNETLSLLRSYKYASGNRKTVKTVWFLPSLLEMMCLLTNENTKTRKKVVTQSWSKRGSMR